MASENKHEDDGGLGDTLIKAALVGVAGYAAYKLLFEPSLAQAKAKVNGPTHAERLTKWGGVQGYVTHLTQVYITNKSKLATWTPAKIQAAAKKAAAKYKIDPTAFLAILANESMNFQPVGAFGADPSNGWAGNPQLAASRDSTSFGVGHVTSRTFDDLRITTYTHEDMWNPAKGVDAAARVVAMLQKKTKDPNVIKAHYTGISANDQLTPATVDVATSGPLLQNSTVSVPTYTTMYDSNPFLSTTDDDNEDGVAGAELLNYGMPDNMDVEEVMTQYDDEAFGNTDVYEIPDDVSMIDLGGSILDEILGTSTPDQGQSSMYVGAPATPQSVYSSCQNIVIKAGYTGACLDQVASNLRRHGYLLSSSDMQSEIRRFQSAYGLSSDGAVGPKTWAALLGPVMNAQVALPSAAPAPGNVYSAPAQPAPQAMVITPQTPNDLDAQYQRGIPENDSFFDKYHTELVYGGIGLAALGLIAAYFMLKPKHSSESKNLPAIESDATMATEDRRIP